jgi:DNA-binding MarR family transcriptional regulator
LRQLSALQIIADDDSTTLGEVARQLMVTPAVVTGLIDRLEKRGYVRRLGSTGDRRRVNLSVTAEGRKAGKAAEERLVREVAAIMEGFSAREIATLEEGLTLLDRVLQSLESGRSR